MPGRRRSRFPIRHLETDMANAMADRRLLRQLDWPLIGAVLALAALGVCMVYSATSASG